jgi:hypothetical protein
MIYWVVVGREMNGHELKHILLLSDNGQRQTMTAKQLKNFQKSNTVVNVRYQGDSLTGIGMRMVDIPTYRKSPSGRLEQTSGLTEQQIIQQSMNLIQQLQQKDMQKKQKEESQSQEETNKRVQWILTRLVAIDKSLSFSKEMKDLTNEQIAQNGVMRYLKQLDIGNADMSVENMVKNYGVRGIAHHLDGSLGRLENRAKKFDLINIDISKVTPYRTIQEYVNTLKPKTKELVKQHDETYSLIKSNKEELTKQEEEQKRQEKEQKKQLKEQMEALENDDNVLIIEGEDKLSDEEADLLKELTCEKEKEAEQEKEEKENLPTYTEIKEAQQKAVNYIHNESKSGILKLVEEHFGIEDSNFESEQIVKDTLIKYVKYAVMSSRQLYVNEEYLIHGLKRFICDKYKRDYNVVNDEGKRLIFIESSEITSGDIDEISKTVASKLCNNEDIQSIAKKYIKKSEEAGLLTFKRILELQEETYNYFWNTFQEECIEDIVDRLLSYYFKVSTVGQHYKKEDIPDSIIKEIKYTIKSVLKGSKTYHIDDKLTNTKYEDSIYYSSPLKKFIITKYIKHTHGGGTEISTDRMLYIPKEEFKYAGKVSIVISAVFDILKKKSSIKKEFDNMPLLDDLRKESIELKRKWKEECQEKLADCEAELNNCEKEASKYERELPEFRSTIGAQLCKKYIKQMWHTCVDVNNSAYMFPMNLLCAIADGLAVDDPTDVHFRSPDYFEVRNKSDVNIDVSMIALEPYLEEENENRSVRAFRETLEEVLYDNAECINLDTVDIAFSRACDFFWNDEILNGIYLAEKYEDDKEIEYWHNWVSKLVHIAEDICSDIRTTEHYKSKGTWGYNELCEKIAKLKEEIADLNQKIADYDSDIWGLHNGKWIKEALELYNDL